MKYILPLALAICAALIMTTGDYYAPLLSDMFFAELPINLSITAFFALALVHSSFALHKMAEYQQWLMHLKNGVLTNKRPKELATLSTYLISKLKKDKNTDEFDLSLSFFDIQAILNKISYYLDEQMRSLKTTEWLILLSGLIASVFLLTINHFQILEAIAGQTQIGQDPSRANAFSLFINESGPYLFPIILSCLYAFLLAIRSYIITFIQSSLLLRLETILTPSLYRNDGTSFHNEDHHVDQALVDLIQDLPTRINDMIQDNLQHVQDLAEAQISFLQKEVQNLQRDLNNQSPLENEPEKGFINITKTR
jgi:hypothetical protein